MSKQKARILIGDGPSYIEVNIPEVERHGNEWHAPHFTLEDGPAEDIAHGIGVHLAVYLAKLDEAETARAAEEAEIDELASVLAGVHAPGDILRSFAKRAYKAGWRKQ